MKTVLLIAGSNLRRFIRNRSFFIVAFLAPLAIMAALSATIGSALTGEFRPSIVIGNEIGVGALDELVAGLRTAGFDDLTVVESGSDAREMVESAQADAAVIFPTSLANPSSQQASAEPSILVLSSADSTLAGEVARSIAEQSAQSFDTVRILSELGAPTDNLNGSISVVTDDSVGPRTLTDGTYFAVGMSAYFSFFAASGFVSTLHRERREETLARMLATPIGRLAPLLGKGLAAGMAALLSFGALVISSTLLLGADWGPAIGTVSVGGALSFSAVGVSMAITSLTRTEESAGQVGTVLSTAWAIFGGVFLEIPASGPLSTFARFSPFTWVLDAIGLNAGTGTLSEVFIRSAAIMLFGVIGLGIAIARRSELGRI